MPLTINVTQEDNNSNYDLFLELNRLNALEVVCNKLRNKNLNVEIKNEYTLVILDKLSSDQIWLLMSIPRIFPYRGVNVTDLDMEILDDEFNKIFGERLN